MSVRRVCKQCGHGNSHGLGGLGIRSNFRSSFLDDLPVCSGCGGLGFQLEDTNFVKLVAEIVKLRDGCSPAEEQLVHIVLPKAIRLQRLKTLVDKIKELFKLYGKAEDISYARDIAMGILDPSITELTREKNEEVNSFRNQKADSIEKKFCQLAWIAIYEGNLGQAEIIFKKGVAKFSESAILLHSYGLMLMCLRGEYKAARPLLIKAVEIEPKSIGIFLCAFSCLIKLGSFEEADKIAQRALRNDKMGPESKEFLKNLQQQFSFIREQRSHMN